jgi:hypothetical protein
MFCRYCVQQADAFLLAIAGGPDLLARIQKRYFEKSKSNVARVRSNKNNVTYIVRNNLLNFTVKLCF